MPPEHLPPAASSYLAAIGAAAVYIAPGPRIGTAARLPQGVLWVAWVTSIEAAEKIATPDLLVRVGDDGIRIVRTVEQVATAIEQRAKQLRFIYLRT